MGLFTWVNHQCECGEYIEFQSKACRTMYTGPHPLNSVPIEVAKDLDGEMQVCECNRRYIIKIAPKDLETVPMIIEDAGMW